MRTIVLDLDGTLADTAADLVAAANATFAAEGIDARLDARADADVALKGGRAMLGRGLERARGRAEEAEIDALYQPLLDHYEGAVATHTQFYPGAVEAVAEMRAAGWRAAVCTNKPERHTLALLDALGLRGHFDAVVAADTHPERKPHPMPYREAVAAAGGDLARSVMVGDTETDRETARAAGVPCILVTFGPEGRAVERLAPEALLERFSDLPEVAARLVR